MFGIQLRLRGQVTVEFIVTLAILMIIFLVAFHALGVDRAHTAQLLWNLDARDSTQRLGEEINAVIVEGPGSNRTAQMPMRFIGGVNYTIKVYPRMVAVDVPLYGREYVWRLLTSNINGSDTTLALNPGEIIIENREKVIYLRNA
jgi:hypothetical protein